MTSKISIINLNNNNKMPTLATLIGTVSFEQLWNKIDKSCQF